MSAPAQEKALFFPGLLTGPCPVDWATWEGSTEHGWTPAVENTAQLQGDVLPFSLDIPFTAAGNRGIFM